MARKQQQQPSGAQPISLSQTRHQRRPGKPSATLAPQSAADRLAARAVLKERTELTGRTDPCHAYRGGYGQGAIDALSVLEQLLDAGIGLDLDTALYELRAWLMGDDFGQWVNAPDDPTEIAPGDWLARRHRSSPTSPSPA